jgi:ATP-dependent Clp protease ATP-binding subunit ClpC
MQAPRSEPDLLGLRKLAEELAKSRKERLTSGHLLAAIASRPSPAQELLLDRKLGADTLLKAARATTDEEPDPVVRAVQRARELAARMGCSVPGSLHLLLSLIHERGSGAHKALAQCGVDVSRLRAAAMQLALGRVGPRRAAGVERMERSAENLARPGPPAQKAPADKPVPVSIVPGPRPPSAPPAALEAFAAKCKRVAPRPAGRAEPFELDPKRLPLLSSLGKNLTLSAARGEIDPVIGRDLEIDQALDILAKRRSNNPLCVGGAGVGKTSLVRGIALRITLGQDVGQLDARTIVEVPIAELLAGSAARGSLAERIAALRAELRGEKGRVVVFFDDIHTLFGGDADEAASELKVALAKGEFPCIGVTSPEEYRRVIEADPALARRFTVVEVDEPSRAETLAILAGTVPVLAGHHEVSFDEDAIEHAVDWSVRYLPGRMLPDKALSILDLAGARARRRGAGRVLSSAVADIVAELTDVPAERLLETDRDRMMALESLLADRVVGHGAALARMAAILRRNSAGFAGRRPIGTFLLLGPTGVGKTESAKAIAHALFHSPDAMTRLDMAEFAEPHSIARLIGAPPGYIGHEAGGQLTEAVRRRPYQVILLDEIEKAHRDVLEAFLSVFDEGRLTDGRGKTIDFTNAVLVMTSNLGSDRVSAKRTRSIGFSGGHNDPNREMEAELVAAARAALPPELYNRIDEIIAFMPLDRREVAEIARRLLAGIAQKLAQARGVHLDVDDEAVEALLVAGGYDPELGARPMKRTLARLVEAPIAEMVLRGDLEPGDVARVTTEDETIVIDVVKKSAA